MKRITPEGSVKKVCMDWLALQPDVWVWRQNTGAVAMPGASRSRFIRFGVPGAADITGVHKPTGRRIEIEVKAPGKKPTEDQAEFLERMLEHGAIAFYADSLEMLIEKFADARLEFGP